MAAGAFSLVLVFLLIFSAGSVEVKKFATGSTQTLSVNAERALKLIEWKHNGNLVVEWHGVGDPTQYRYDDYAKLNTNNGVLTIKMLKDYSGEYKCQYQYTDVDTFQEKIFQVEVIDPVSIPKVTCKKNGTNITLKCATDSSAQANFKWKGPDDFSHLGDSVHITNPETKDSYFCTATNDVSEETAEFKLTDCHSEDDPVETINLGAIFGALIGIAIAIVGLGALGYSYHTKKGFFKTSATTNNSSAYKSAPATDGQPTVVTTLDPKQNDG